MSISKSPKLILPALAIALGVPGTMAQESASTRGLASLRVPEGFTVEVAAGPDKATGAVSAAFDEHGRLFLAEVVFVPVKGATNAFKPAGRIRMLVDTNNDGVFDRSLLFAEGLGVPSGVLSHLGRLLVAAPPDLVRLDDVDRDGKADRRTLLLSGWNRGDAAGLHGPFAGPEGALYLASARGEFGIKTREATTLTGTASRVWRMKPDGAQIGTFAGGSFDGVHRIVFLPSGEMLGNVGVLTNKPGGLRSGLTHFIEGGVYAGPGVAKDIKLSDSPLPTISIGARGVPWGLVICRSPAAGEGFRGSLFATHLNPGSVTRHILTREGATFRTVESGFLSSTDPEFSPIEVIEDADGSLLVLDSPGVLAAVRGAAATGKPGVRSVIYRVRRRDSPRMDDARGDFLRSVAPRLSHGALVNSLLDPRPAVRDLAAKLLRERVSSERTPAGALPELLRLREKGGDIEARCIAVQQLARFGALGAVAAALDDTSVDVRVAAARALGDARFFGHFAGPDVRRRLQQTLRVDPPPVRREAATTLGRLGDESSGPALLAAATHAADPFEEHAILHALVLLNDRALMNASVNSTDAGIRRAAQIVLGQWGGRTSASAPGPAR